MIIKKAIEKPDMNNLPVHIAAIMDGNGRWASSKGLPRTVGHKAGSEAFRKISEYLNDIGVKYFTVYAFSTENWKRPKDEVSAIMKLLKEYLLEAISDMAEKNIRLCFFGDQTPLSDELKDLIRKTDEISKGCTGLTVNVCLNYGGRDEITRAVQAIVKDGVKPKDITEKLISSYLYSKDTPDPDLIIRPGKEQRISNFLLWQCAYSEFYFTETLWPDMNEEEMNKAIISFQKRKRRFGGI